MMMFKRVLLCLVGAWGLGGALALAQTPPTYIETPSTRVDVLGERYRAGVPIGATQSRIVVYSQEDLSLVGATSIFVNGTYHASLVKGAYSDLCYSPGKVELGARQAEVGQRAKDRPDSTTAVQLAGGQAQFVRVIEQGGRPVLQTVTADQAARELPSKRLQLHTISRVAQACAEVAAPQVPVAAPVVAPVVAAEPKRHTLAADTLFATARSDFQGMAPAGLRAIDRLIERLPKEYSRIESIKIVGHADPLGNDALNERLALERAQTVRQYIVSTSQLQTPISAEGRGSREPVATGCGLRRTPQARVCHQPNRRVEIEVTGQRHP